MKRDRLDDISQEELRRLFAYDPETGVVTRKVSVSANTKVGDVVGYLGNHGYFQVMISGTKYLLHRVIWRLVTGDTPPEQIDHVNHNKVDNRRLNLRLTSHPENARNQSMRSDNTSGHLGVCWNRAAQKWMAQIKVEGKTNYLGLFDDKADAIAAREAANLRFDYHPNHGAPATA